MLDLKELERKVNESLAKETKESLSKWLREKRVKAHLATLGAGKYIESEEIKCDMIENIKLDKIYTNSHSQKESVELSSFYKYAA